MTCSCHPEYHLLGVHQPGYGPNPTDTAKEANVPEQHPASNSDARKRFEEKVRAGGAVVLADGSVCTDLRPMRAKIADALAAHSYDHEAGECMCGGRGGLDHVAAQVTLVVAPYVQPKAGAR